VGGYHLPRIHLEIQTITFLCIAIYRIKDRVIREENEFAMRRSPSRKKRKQFTFCFINRDRKRFIDEDSM